mmetsp:Transcript_7541/g.19181  ORF Transcript_7541/g.19181 Transcript_7541/m.19181 type:complete len:208 (+) Transcript_7541:448-1071(+)|eukprot:CAMPEP_0197602890 /NCGR_PEP_ID=MMETSP1326-20131121/38115_1 /TAXON_ID=1155430 /ORGANISM="Genus nov. species nov., Strain RCC2288" /LENGTH=207 /DNA_ID=CAMNT_0043170325 /DNA_START=427 /DNA_END=1050 /DNA_ORIENTATION=+
MVLGGGYEYYVLPALLGLIIVVVCFAPSGQRQSGVAAGGVSGVPQAAGAGLQQHTAGAVGGAVQSLRGARGKSIRKITVNVSSFWSKDGAIRPDAVASVRDLVQRYDVYFLAVCTSADIRMQVRSVFKQLELIHLEKQQRVIFTSTRKGLASVIRQLEPDIHVDTPDASDFAQFTPQLIIVSGAKTVAPTPNTVSVARFSDVLKVTS